MKSEEPINGGTGYLGRRLGSPTQKQGGGHWAQEALTVASSPEPSPESVSKSGIGVLAPGSSARP